ncbi:MAG: prepilin-type N-terminal cleavage/methylation domain-containing protein [Deltaproteobacteria bacterium]|nr:prepilin-type N-terminal cleavage/methylation domain-containing protein [Deltaproteobacteria bacterium]
MKRTGIPKGYTLVEVAIVMALMTITASFAVPAWQNYTINTNLKTAARQLMADVVNTSHRAIAENSNIYRITFNVNNNNYSLSRVDTGVILWTKSLVSFGGGNSIQSVNINGGSIINFQRRGIITPTSGGTIILKNNIDSRATITVQLTGRAYVQYNLQK